jgi:hypothetical protein
MPACDSHEDPISNCSKSKPLKIKNPNSKFYYFLHTAYAAFSVFFSF